jgi:hypothetical protein
MKDHLLSQDSNAIVTEKTVEMTAQESLLGWIEMNQKLYVQIARENEVLREMI